MDVMHYYVKVPDLRWCRVPLAVFEALRAMCESGAERRGVEFLRVWESGEWDCEQWSGGRMRIVEGGEPEELDRFELRTPGKPYDGIDHQAGAHAIDASHLPSL